MKQSEKNNTHNEYTISVRKSEACEKIGDEAKEDKKPHKIQPQTKTCHFMSIRHPIQLQTLLENSMETRGTLFLDSILKC